MTKGKIETSAFTKQWNGGTQKGVIYYHDLKFEGDPTTYQIGAKEQNPPFLAVGQTLAYEVTKENKIKRVKDEEAPAPSSTPSRSGGGYQKRNDNYEVGVTVGAALNQAVMLASNGKIELKDVKLIAKRLAEIAFELKAEFSN